MHLVITDSGLGGLTVCAALEGVLRRTASPRAVRITYVNAWPEQDRGYNDLPDDGARVAVFDRALAHIDGTGADLLVIACNTLSILYQATEHQQRGRIPVRGIIDAGVQLFVEALEAHPTGAILLVGTKTTIASEAHRSALVARGVTDDRIAAVSCHGLATAIERDPRGPDASGAIARCAGAVRDLSLPPGDPLLLGLCCTHYGMVARELADAVAAAVGRRVEPLDPNARLVGELAARLARSDGNGPGGANPETHVAVQVRSKVRLDASKREAVASLLEPVSPATALALRAYVHVPDLF